MSTCKNAILKIKYFYPHNDDDKVNVRQTFLMAFFAHNYTQMLIAAAHKVSTHTQKSFFRRRREKFVNNKLKANHKKLNRRVVVDKNIYGGKMCTTTRKKVII